MMAHSNSHSKLTQTVPKKSSWKLLEALAQVFWMFSETPSRSQPNSLKTLFHPSWSKSKYSLTSMLQLVPVFFQNSRKDCKRLTMKLQQYILTELMIITVVDTTDLFCTVIVWRHKWHLGHTRQSSQTQTYNLSRFTQPWREICSSNFSIYSSCREKQSWGWQMLNS